jgi:hypothetical protein
VGSPSTGRPATAAFALFATQLLLAFQSKQLFPHLTSLFGLRRSVDGVQQPLDVTTVWVFLQVP